MNSKNDDSSIDNPYSTVLSKKNESDRQFNWIGKKIGSYSILETIGKGGMGNVFLAKQAPPSLPPVALKITRVSFVDGTHVSRFKNEIRTVSLMDHPNIAKLLDVGQTPDGTPYFAMEFIDGCSITDYCDQHKLDVHQRLKLAVKVCRAIAHAHKAGVIHRDIKPSNILIQKKDDDTVLKVIDFGLAKILSDYDSDAILTLDGQVVGTPEYMSPEQAKGDIHSLDTRTDIFSLGILIFELITGSTPIRSSSAKNLGIQKVLQEMEQFQSVRPSFRIQDSSDQLELVSTNRSLTPSRLIKTVKGDLDWIVLKATEYDRERRYGSCDELANDLEAFLENRPIAARPPSVFYTTKKLFQRNRLAFCFSLALTFVVLTALGTGWWLAFYALNAKNAETLAKRNAENALKDSEISRVRSNASLKLVMDSFRQSDKYLPSKSFAADLAIEKAFQASEESFRDDPSGKAEFLHQLAIALLRLQKWEKCQEITKRALQTLDKAQDEFDPILRIKMLNTLSEAHFKNGNFNKSLEVADRAIEGSNKVPVNRWTLTSKIMRSMSLLGNRKLSESQHDLAIAEFDEAIKVLESKKFVDTETILHKKIQFAEVVLVLKRNQEATSLVESVIAESEKSLGKTHSLTMLGKILLGRCFFEGNRLGECQETLDSVLSDLTVSFPPHHPSVLHAEILKMDCFFREGRLPDVEKSFKRISPLVESTFGKNSVFSFHLLATYTSFLQKQNRFQEATEFQKKIVAIQEVLGVAEPIKATIQKLSLASMLYQQRKYTQSIRILEELRRSYESQEMESVNYPQMLKLLSVQYHFTNQLKKAKECREALVDHYKKNAKDNEFNLAESYFDLGRIYFYLLEYDKAIQHLRIAEKMIQPTFQKKNQAASGRLLALCFVFIGKSEQAKGATGKTREAFLEAFHCQKEVLKKTKGNHVKDSIELRKSLVRLHRFRKNLKIERSDIDFRQELQNLIAWNDLNLGKDHDESLRSRIALVDVSLPLRLDDNLIQDTFAVCREAEQIATRMSKSNPTNFWAWYFIAYSSEKQSFLYKAMGLEDSMDRALKRTLLTYEKMADLFATDLTAMNSLSRTIDVSIKRRAFWTAQSRKKLIVIRNHVEQQKKRLVMKATSNTNPF